MSFYPFIAKGKGSIKNNPFIFLIFHFEGVGGCVCQHLMPECLFCVLFILDKHLKPWKQWQDDDHYAGKHFARCSRIASANLPSNTFWHQSTPDKSKLTLKKEHYSFQIIITKYQWDIFLGRHVYSLARRLETGIVQRRPSQSWPSSGRIRGI